MNNKLNKGDQFPEMSLSITGDGKLTLPADLDKPYVFVLFYRGYW